MAVKTYTKGVKTKISEHFYSTEFDCHCSRKDCKITLIDEQLVQDLEVLRAHFGGKAVHINSGYRCAKHNTAVGGVDGSWHVKGYAVDMVISGVNVWDVARAGDYLQKEQGRTRGEIGRYSSWVHYGTNHSSKLSRYTGTSQSTFPFFGEYKNAPVTKENIDTSNTQSNVYTIDSQRANERTIWNYLKQAGLNDYAVAGIMGNMQAESDLYPFNVQDSYEKTVGSNSEYTKKVDNGTYTNFVNDGAGYGLVQWTHSSLKEPLLNYARKKKTSISNLNTQLEFLIHNLTTVGQYVKDVWRPLLNITSYEEATKIFLLKYENPEDQSQKVIDKRIGFAKQFYDTLHNKVEDLLLSFPKGSTEKVSADYMAKDFECQCSSCNKTLINKTIIGWTERLNSAFSIKLKISSGYRCSSYDASQAKQGEKGDGNFHTYGAAVDLSLPEGTDESLLNDIIAYAEGIGPTGIGKYSKNGKKWIHLDNRIEKAFWQSENDIKSSVTTFGGPEKYPELFQSSTNTTIVSDYSITNPPLELFQKDHQIYKDGVYVADEIKGVVFHFLPVPSYDSEHLITLGEYLQPDSSMSSAEKTNWKEKLGNNILKTSLNQSTDRPAYHAYIGNIRNISTGETQITTIQALPWGMCTNAVNPASLAPISTNFNYGWIHIGVYLSAPLDTGAMKEITRLMKYLSSLYVFHPKELVQLEDGLEIPQITTSYELYLLGGTLSYETEATIVNADLLRQRLSNSGIWDNKSLYSYHITRKYNTLNEANSAKEGNDETLHYLEATNVFFTNSKADAITTIGNAYGLCIVTLYDALNDTITSEVINKKIQHLLYDRVKLNKQAIIDEGLTNMYPEYLYNLILYVSKSNYINEKGSSVVDLASYYRGPSIITAFTRHVTKDFSSNNSLGKWKAVKEGATYITGEPLPVDQKNVFVISMDAHCAIITNNQNAPAQGIIYVDQFL